MHHKYLKGGIRTYLMNFVYDAPNANFEDDDYENKIEKESKDNS